MNLKTLKKLQLKLKLGWQTDVSKETIKRICKVEYKIENNEDRNEQNY